MKKKISVFIVLFVAAAASLHAQSFKLGIKLGSNLTKIDGQSFQDGFKLSYHAGAFAEIDLSKKLGIQPEVLFNQTSSKTTNNLNDIVNGLNPNADFKLNYLSIPILLRYNVNNFITLNAGPQYSILLSSDKSLVQSGKDAFKSGDFSAVAGIQLNLSSLRVYGRYVIGLSEINDITSQQKWKNQQVQLGLGIKL